MTDSDRTIALDTPPPAQAAGRARHYVRRGKVSGWLSASAAHVMIDVATRLPVQGRPVCEIGVHHGKLAILLGLLTGGRLVAYDLFSRQDENVDGSGRGHEATFIENCRRYLGSGADVVPREVNSLHLTGAAVTADCGAPPVLFSVDGGHTAELTMNDLEIAADATAQDGIVILDDFYNEAWPEVAFGATRFFAAFPGALHPFCIVGNKILLARDATLATNLSRFLASRPSSTYPGVYHIGTCDILGRPVTHMRAATGLDATLRRIAATDGVRRFKASSVGSRMWRMLGR